MVAELYLNLLEEANSAIEMDESLDREITLQLIKYPAILESDINA